ncbi:MAG: sugar phosphate isomerase/epimerase [Clostridia bacterium]|nr:sugar phosphate isomerase/epimerase [Clostridia bacterium]
MEALKIYAFADEASSSVDEQIKAMKENGLDGLEIRGVDGTNIADITVEKAREVRKKMDAAGLVTWSIGSPSGKIGINDEFAPHLDKFRHMLEIADILGAKMFRLFSFYMPKDEDPAVYRDEVMARLNAFCDAAQGSAVTLCHENEKGIYGDIAPRCLDILTSVPRLKGIFDPANFIQCSQDTAQGWEMLRDKIIYLHVKDATADGRVVPAGNGIGNLKMIVEQFRQQGGEAVTLEPHLTVFDSLASLEREGEKTRIDPFTYETPRKAFDAAVSAFRAL